MFQKIIPTEMATTATPLILLRSFLKWVQMQLRTGMAPRQKHESGTTSQKIANVTMLKWILIIIGESKNTKAHMRIAVLYPTNLAKGLERSTATLVGIRAQRRMIELVLRLTSKPVCLRYEKK